MPTATNSLHKDTSDAVQNFLTQFWTLKLLRRLPTRLSKSLHREWQPGQLESTAGRCKNTEHSSQLSIPSSTLNVMLQTRLYTSRYFGGFLIKENRLKITLLCLSSLSSALTSSREAFLGVSNSKQREKPASRYQHYSIPFPTGPGHGPVFYPLLTTVQEQTQNWPYSLQEAAMAEQHIGQEPASEGAPPGSCVEQAAPWLTLKSWRGCRSKAL